jgi:hypothetical protein
MYDSLTFDYNAHIKATVKNGVTDVKQFGVLDGLMGQIILRQGGGARDQAFLLRILSLVKQTMVLRSREINLFFALKGIYSYFFSMICSLIDRSNVCEWRGIEAVLGTQGRHACY